MKWLPLVLLSTLVSSVMSFALEIEPLLPDDKLRPYRASVLLLGNGLPDKVASEVQEQMEDTVTLYRLSGKIESAEQVLVVLKEPAGRHLVNRRWHAVLISLPEEGEKDKTTVSAIETELKKLSAEVVWSGPQREAKAVAEQLRGALLRKSTPWVELPEGEKRDPARLLEDAELLSDTDKLELVPSRTVTVFNAVAGEWQFNLHSFIARHDGKFWAIWSSGRKDEDSSSQLIRYATSENGLKWSEARILAGDPDGENGPLRWLASGLYERDGKLYALGCLNVAGQKGKVWGEAKLMRMEWNGNGWEEGELFADKCMVYFPPMPVKGRDFLVWRDEYAHFFTARSLPGVAQWEVKRHPGFPPDYRMSETSSYIDPDGVLHLIIRDQGKTRRIYRSLSYDDGATWTLPVKTNYPDAVSKNLSGRLSNGWYYLINNPKTRSRDPLGISLSKDGWTYGRPKALRAGSPRLRFEGKAKGGRSFQYADAMEHDGKLWVIYATNKEDIEVSAFEIEDLLK